VPCTYGSMTDLNQTEPHRSASGQFADSLQSPPNLVLHPGEAFMPTYDWGKGRVVSESDEIGEWLDPSVTSGGARRDIRRFRNPQGSVR
jgi:hypothetical protein